MFVYIDVHFFGAMTAKPLCSVLLITIQCPFINTEYSSAAFVSLIGFGEREGDRESERSSLLSRLHVKTPFKVIIPIPSRFSTYMTNSVGQASC